MFPLSSHATSTPFAQASLGIISLSDSAEFPEVKYGMAKIAPTTSAVTVTRMLIMSPMRLFFCGVEAGRGAGG